LIKDGTFLTDDKSCLGLSVVDDKWIDWLNKEIRSLKDAWSTGVITIKVYLLFLNVSHCLYKEC